MIDTESVELIEIVTHLIEEFEELERDFVAGEEMSFSIMEQKIPRMLSYLETFTSIEHPNEQEQLMRVMLPDAARLVIYRTLCAQKRLELYRQAYNDASCFGFQDAKAIYCRDVGNSIQDLGQLEKAIEWLQHAEQLYHSEELQEEIGLLKSDIASCMRKLGRIREAEVVSRESIEQLKKVKDEPCLASQFNNHGIILFELGKISEAEASYQQALLIQEELGLDKEAGATLRREVKIGLK